MSKVNFNLRKCDKKKKIGTSVNYFWCSFQDSRCSLGININSIVSIVRKMLLNNYQKCQGFRQWGPDPPPPPPLSTTGAYPPLLAEKIKIYSIFELLKLKIQNLFSPGGGPPRPLPFGPPPPLSNISGQNPECNTYFP